MMNRWAPFRGDSLLTRYKRNVNASLLINSSAAMLQDLDDFLEQEMSSQPLGTVMVRL